MTSVVILCHAIHCPQSYVYDHTPLLGHWANYKSFDCVGLRAPPTFRNSNTQQGDYVDCEEGQLVPLASSKPESNITICRGMDEHRKTRYSYLPWLQNELFS